MTGCTNFDSRAWTCMKLYWSTNVVVVAVVEAVGAVGAVGGGGVIK